MLHKIFTAIRAAMRALARLIRIPGQILGGLFGGGAYEIIEDDDGAPDETVKAEAVDKSAIDRQPLEKLRRETLAHCVIAYAADAQADFRRPALASTMPRSIKDWLPGLGFEELQRITDAGAKAVEAHIAGEACISGVPRVSRLGEMRLMRPAPRDANTERLPWFTRGYTPEAEVYGLRPGA